MKKIIFGLLITSLFFFISCGEEENIGEVLLPININRAAQLPQGQPIGSFNNVTAYSNLGGHSIRNGTYGYEYQCVEYVSRYLKLAMNFPSSGILRSIGHAKSWWGNSGGGKMDRYANGGSVAPEVNDALVWTGGSYGHIAIIREVNISGGYIVVIQQNVYQSKTDANYRIGLNNSGGRYTLSSPELPGVTIAGWLRIPGSCNSDCSYAGEKTCSGSNIKECKSSNGCLKYRTVKTCSSGWSCDSSTYDCKKSDSGSGNGGTNCEASSLTTSSNDSAMYLLMFLFLLVFIRKINSQKE